MAITYRTDGAWGTGAGADLTPAQVDTNFYTLDQRIDAVETSVPAPVEISNITLSGSVMTITMSDTTTYTVTVPAAAFVWRGAWAPTTAYLALDLVQVEGFGIYLVLEAHTSPAVWDENHLVGADPAYQLMFSDPRAVVATEAGATLTPALADAFSYTRCTDAGGCAVTIPTNAAVPFAVGTELHFVQRGAAAVSIAGDTGVTVNVPAGRVASTFGVGAVATVKKVATDEWDLFGALGDA